MASNDDQNPYRHAPKGETPAELKSRKTNYYKYQRQQAESLSDKGDQGASQRASQIYGKLAKGGDKRTVDEPYFSNRQEEDQSKAQQYGVRGMMPGQTGRLMGDAVQATQLGAKAMTEGPGIADVIKAAAPMVSKIVQAVSTAARASQQQRPPGTAMMPGRPTPPRGVVGNQQTPVRPTTQNVLGPGRRALPGGREEPPLASTPRKSASSKTSNVGKAVKKLASREKVDKADEGQKMAERTKERKRTTRKTPAPKPTPQPGPAPRKMSSPGAAPRKMSSSDKPAAAKKKNSKKKS